MKTKNMVEVEFRTDIDEQYMFGNFELIYPEQLRTSSEDRQRLKKWGAKFILMRDAKTHEPIGETYYLPLDVLGKHMLTVQDYCDKKAAYVYKSTILPKFQKQGYGKLMTEFRLTQMRKEGYLLSVGHARTNGSVVIAKHLGAEIMGTVDNWCASGEQVSICVLDLYKIPPAEIEKAAHAFCEKTGYQFLEKIACKAGFREAVNFASNYFK